MNPFERNLRDILREPESRIVVLTGAGVSADSGIPTFRGEEGYWREGSAVYTPMELATWRMFRSHPERVWDWYRMRLQVCRNAHPNESHYLLARMQQLLGPQLTLVTQNVDGLHGRAGSPASHTFEIHGNIEKMRCSAPGCGFMASHPALDSEGARGKSVPYTCPRCDEWLRPHVLWFDETYDEAHYRATSTLRAAADADLLIFCGTSGQTSLPIHILQLGIDTGALVLDINPEANPFSEIAREQGLWWKMSASNGFSKLWEILSKANPIPVS